MSGTPTVAVVDDERDITDIYASWLANDEWMERPVNVRTAYGGEEALQVVDGDVDIVLLDRMMPELSGDDVLCHLRDRGFEGWVVMLTALEPDIDVCELPFDDYLVKPVYRDDLSVVVNRMLDRGDYDDDHVTEYFATASKLAAVEQYMDEDERVGREEYEQLVERVRGLEEYVGDGVRRDHREFRAMLYDLSDRA